MIAELNQSKPFPMIPVLLSVLFAIIGIVGLIDALRPTHRRIFRVPALMDAVFGRMCISLWCLALSTVGFGRAFHLPLITEFESWLYVIGFGLLGCGLLYGYFAHKPTRQIR